MDLHLLSDDELILLHIEIEKEMSSRHNSLSVGETGEKLAIKFFCSTPKLPNLKAAETGTKNVDAFSRDGERYSIKTTMKAKKTGTIYPDLIKPDKQLFEYLLIIQLTKTFMMESLYRFSWQQFLQIRAWDIRMNAWYVPISKTRLIFGECLFLKDDNS